MAFKAVAMLIAGLQEIDDTSTTQNHEIGLRVQGFDPTYRGGEFIYLKGVASTAIADLVVYDVYANTTARTGTNSRGPCAVAMSANVASQFGWYQVFGAAVVNCATVAADQALYLTSTAGRVDDAEVATDLVVGMVSKTGDGTPAANRLVAQIAYPGVYELDTP